MASLRNVAFTILRLSGATGIAAACASTPGALPGHFGPS